MPSNRSRALPPSPPPASDDILARFYSSIEKLVLFFAFDFTIENWKQYFLRKPKINDEINYRKVSKECIHGPFVPPRNGQRKNVRAGIKTFGKSEPKMVPSKQQLKKVKASNIGADGTQNGGMMPESPIVPELPPCIEATEIDSAFTSPEITTFNPFTLLIEPFINFWSNNNSQASLTNLNDQSQQAADESFPPGIESAGPHKTMDEIEMEELRKQAEKMLIENPEQFIGSEIAKELADRSSDKQSPHQYFCINRKTTFQLEPLTQLNTT